MEEINVHTEEDLSERLDTTVGDFTFGQDGLTVIDAPANTPIAPVRNTLKVTESKTRVRCEGGDVPPGP